MRKALLTSLFLVFSSPSFSDKADESQIDVAVFDGICYRNHDDLGHIKNMMQISDAKKLTEDMMNFAVKIL